MKGAWTETEREINKTQLYAKLTIPKEMHVSDRYYITEGDGSAKCKVEIPQKEKGGPNRLHGSRHLNWVLGDAWGSTCHAKTRQRRSRTSEKFAKVSGHMTGGYRSASWERAPRGTRIKLNLSSGTGEAEKEASREASTQIGFVFLSPRSGGRWRTEQRARPEAGRVN